MIIQGWDLNLIYNWSLHHTIESWLRVVLSPLFTPTVSVYWLIQAIHISSTLPIFDHWYTKWLGKIKNGIHPPQPSQHSDFWVTGGENYGLGSLLPTPRLSGYKLFPPFHISSTHPISQHYYNEWLEKVEIGIWTLKCLPQSIFWSWVGTIFAWHKSTFCT